MSINFSRLGNSQRRCSLPRDMRKLHQKKAFAGWSSLVPWRRRRHAEQKMAPEFVQASPPTPATTSSSYGWHKRYFCSCLSIVDLVVSPPTLYSVFSVRVSLSTSRVGLFCYRPEFRPLPAIPMPLTFLAVEVCVSLRLGQMSKQETEARRQRPRCMFIESTPVTRGTRKSQAGGMSPTSLVSFKQLHPLPVMKLLEKCKCSFDKSQRGQWALPTRVTTQSKVLPIRRTRNVLAKTRSECSSCKKRVRKQRTSFPGNQGPCRGILVKSQRQHELPLSWG